MSMTRQEQLDAVVRNYGVWPARKELDLAYWDGLSGKHPIGAGFANSKYYPHEKCEGCYTFTRAEVEHRKAELQNKPSWDDAPEGANILIQTNEGVWIFGTYHDAIIDSACSDWNGIGSGKWMIKELVDAEVIGDWRDTLEKRPAADDQPTPEEEEAFKAMEKSAHSAEVSPMATNFLGSLDDLPLVEEKYPSSWNGEGLPPVGALCEAFDHAKGGKWVKGKMLMHGNSDHAFASGSPEKWNKLFWACKFRPIKSDREKFVGDCLDYFIAHHDDKPIPDVFNGIAGIIYEAIKSGKLKMPEVE